MRALLTGAFIDAVLIALFSIICIPVGQAQTANAISECDRLAASREDSTKPPGVPGVEFNAMDAGKAVAACSAAVRSEPNNARMQFQYGRALMQSRQAIPAMDAFKRAANLGSVAAAGYIGMILDYGFNEIKPDKKAALAWYEYAAKGGFALANLFAARILEKGEGLSGPDLERAAFYWRVLADGGDAMAADHLTSWLSEKKISPLRPNEILERCMPAADKGWLSSATECAYFLKNRNASSQDIVLGAKYALRAYRLARAAPADSAEGWPVIQLINFTLYDDFIKAGAENSMTLSEYAQAKSDFQKEVKLVSIKIDCKGKKEDFDFYLWQWNRSYPPTDWQAEWLLKAKKCTVPENVTARFKEIFALSRTRNASFPVMAQNAINGESKSGMTASQIAGLGIGAVVSVGACWYWRDQCKELVWEAAKQGAREVVKSRN